MDLSQALCLPVSVPEILQANQLQPVSSHLLDATVQVLTAALTKLKQQLTPFLKLENVLQILQCSLTSDLK